MIPDDGPCFLKTNTLYLGRTEEFTSTKGSLFPMLEGRSSIGRLGFVLFMLRPVFGDVGFFRLLDIGNILYPTYKDLFGS